MSLLKTNNLIVKTRQQLTKMKKSIIAAIAIISVLASCDDKNNDGPQSVITQQYTSLCLFSPEDGGKSYIGDAEYKVAYNQTTGNATLDANLSSGFTIDMLTIPSTPYNTSGEGIDQVISFSSKDGNYSAENGSHTVSDFNALATRSFNTASDVPLYGRLDAMSARIYFSSIVNGLFSIKSFYADAVYCGQTITNFQYNGADNSFTSKEGSYRVVINSREMKADVILYNIKFAEQAPSLILRLKGLNLTLQNGFYTISGTDIVPEQVEGSGYTPNESFPFEKFTLTTSSDMLDAVSIEYQVLNAHANLIYKGSFRGSALKNR